VSAALLATTLAGCATSTPPVVHSAAHQSSTPPSSISTTTAPTATTTAPTTTVSISSGPPTTSAPAPAGQPLPLAADPGSASQVITVVAPNASATTAQLREWTKVPGGWQPVSANIPANLGTAGLTTHPSETVSATPIGSFTLTQAFGRDTNPGTALPYLHTTPDDWWISQPGPLYNTHQRCASNCAFTTSASGPNEHLYYETPYYNYAVVIDYNTGPRITPGAGSAFFLHVTVGAPTQGCVAIPVDALLPLMRWLNPADNPRILIGIG
jgi:L,D-peptidoglycan transpeptidase YkuD (ErfK/YbiS/YcfS/YnhG family)